MADEDAISRAIMAFLALATTEPSAIADLRQAWESHELPSRPVEGADGLEQLQVAADYLRSLVVTGRSIDAVNTWAGATEDASGRSVLLMSIPRNATLEGSSDSEADSDDFPQLTDSERAFVESLASLVSQIDEFLAAADEDRPNG